MIIREKSIFTIALLSVLIAALSITGCARKKTSEKIVAVVNDYKMTVEDFNYESREVLRMGRLLGEIPVTKEDILDALIAKELLLQEAQKRNLDKDRNFMKTIELYWEQTLIRDLLTKKSREIEKTTAVYENEIVDYYDKMKNKIKAKVLVFGNERSGRKLLSYEGDVAEYAERESERFALLYVIPSRLYTLGEDNSPLENSIFNVESGKNRDLVQINGKWGLIIIEEEIPAEPGPLSAARDRIVKLIKTRKEKALMNEWIDTLRSDARIKIDKKVLSEGYY